MIPVTRGSANLPNDEQAHKRYEVNGVTAVESSPYPLPEFAVPHLVTGDVLTTSDSAHGPYDVEEVRRIHVYGWESAMNMALSGKRNDADQTRLQHIRLAAVGFVNAHDVIAGVSRPDMPLLTSEVESVP